MFNNNGQNGPVMYAVVLQSALDPRLADYQRRFRALSGWGAHDDEDDEMEDAQDDIAEEPHLPNLSLNRNIGPRNPAVRGERIL